MSEPISLEVREALRDAVHNSTLFMVRLQGEAGRSGEQDHYYAIGWERHQRASEVLFRLDREAAQRHDDRAPAS